MRVERMGVSSLAVMIGAAMVAVPASAQGSAASERPVLGAVEGIVGHAVFADDGPIHHSVFGVAAPIRVSPRVSVGPEIVRMIGPGEDRDWVFAGVVWFDLLRPTGARPRLIVPFVVAGGGLFTQSDRFGSSTEGYVGWGAGVRVRVIDRVYVAPELQYGWELHVRISARIGYTWKER